MKTLIFKIAFVAFILSSCNMGKHYANYRAGGKSDRENSDPSVDERKVIFDSDSKNHTPAFPVLTQMSIKDSFSFTERNAADTKREALLHSKNNLTKSKLKVPDGKNTCRKAKAEKKIRRKVKNTISFFKTPMKSEAGATIGIILIILTVGVLAWLISGSVLTGILAGILFVAGGILGLFLMGAIIIWGIGKFLEGIIEGSNRRFKRPRHFYAKIKMKKKADLKEIAEGVGSILLLIGLLVYVIFFAGIGWAEIIGILLAVGLGVLIFWGLWKLFEGFLFMFDN